MEDCDPDNATCKKYIRLSGCHKVATTDICFFVRICQHQTGNQIRPPALSGELHGAKR